MSTPTDQGSSPDEATLDSFLDRLPAPPMPEGLAARIVQDVTRLPQVAAEEPAPAPFIALPVRTRRRWIAWTGGGAGLALAASLAAMLVVPRTAVQAPVKAPQTNGTATPTVEAAQDPAVAPRSPAASTPATHLAADRPVPANPAVSSTPAPVTPSSPPANEIADNTPAPAAETAPTDSVEADDQAEMVDSGNADAPMLSGSAPTPGTGWGYAPGARSAYPSTQSEPAPPPDEGGGIRRRRPGRF